MLPTKNKSMLHLAETNNSDVKLLITSAKETGDSDLYLSKPQSIFFTSKDLINKGEYFIYPYETLDGTKYEILRCSDVEDGWVSAITHQTPENKSGKAIQKHHCIKIIASSDKTLTPNSWIPESFINKYATSYNAKYYIKEVSLEIESGYTSPIGVIGVDRFPVSWIKTREDGSVIVHKNKTYSEEEVFAIAQEAWIESFFTKRSTDITGFEEWKNKVIK